MFSQSQIHLTIIMMLLSQSQEKSSLFSSRLLLSLVIFIIVSVIIVIQCVNKSEFQFRRNLNSFSLNYAPNLPINSNLCISPSLWGNSHAGGWKICSDINYIDFSKCIVYSYGLGADWSFDNQAELKGCIVHGFDPTGKLWRDGNIILMILTVIW